MNQVASIVGIDVAKDKLDVFIDASGELFTVPNNPDGFVLLRQRLNACAIHQVVIEHSGRYERQAALDLMDAGYAVALINPRQTRNFARAINWLAKNDRIDARLLAEFGKSVPLQPSIRTSENQMILDELVGRRRQLVQMRAAERMRLQQAMAKGVVSSIEKVLRQLDAQVQDLDRRIAKLIENNDDWRGKAQLLQSVPGVGPVLANTLIAEMPELGNANRQQIAALAGVAPYDRESGKWKGKRTCAGGRASVRAVLYMAAITARRCNPIIRNLAQRLANAGKPFKLVMTACMRKLLTILNIIAKTANPWNPEKLNIA